jgi:hypothetical protein
MPELEARMIALIRRERGDFDDSVRSVTGFATPSLMFCKSPRFSKVSVGVANSDRLK